MVSFCSFKCKWHTSTDNRRKTKCICTHFWYLAYNLNKVTHSWEAIGQIPLSRDSAAVVSTTDNRLVVIGGRNDDAGEATNTVWIGSCVPQ